MGGFFFCCENLHDVLRGLGRISKLTPRRMCVYTKGSNATVDSECNSLPGIFLTTVRYLIDTVMT